MITRRARRRVNSQQEVDQIEEAATLNVITIEDSPNEESESNNMTDTEADVHMKTPEGSNTRLTACAVQTTPGLALNGPPIEQGQVAKTLPLNDSMDEEQSCPICFEMWTSAGAHRLVSLPCGHLFGRSCIERWLKEPKNKCCPQCKSTAKRKDIRNIFAKSLKALDTSEKEQVKKAFLEEQYKRSKAEENEAKAVLQCQLMQAEMEKLRKQISEQANQTKSSVASSSRGDVAGPSGSGVQSTFMARNQFSPMKATQQHSQQQRRPANPRRPALSDYGKSYKFQRTLQVSQKDARVLAYDGTHMTMVVTKPSPNQLFKGFGVFKVSSLEQRSSEYISIHSNTIRDAKFNPTGDRLLLTASVDKTLKLTSVLSNSMVQSYTCPNPVWACAWDESNCNYVYAGLQNGQCYVYDIRQTSGELSVIRPRLGVPRPIVSLAYVPPGNENSVLRCQGVLVGTLQGGWFIQNVNNENFIDHQLILPEGSCSGLYFDKTNRSCLLSQRPGKSNHRIIQSVFQLAGDCTQNNPIHANIVQRCFGGNRSQSLTRSILFPCPEATDHLMVASGDEASASVILWDGNNGKDMPKLSCTGGTIFDVLSFEAYNSHFIAALTEKTLNFFQWQ
ncbi:E3 ubiquitin-protein ligase rfwd3.S-like [Clytia hemisphaerica]|uniref:RING-type E3 ubiquitin transferase n=1 Tax=Clytia hemisphaerica TaxID=252671 RepID=A0A7M5XEX6_9CNID